MNRPAQCLLLVCCCSVAVEVCASTARADASLPTDTGIAPDAAPTTAELGVAPWKGVAIGVGIPSVILGAGFVNWWWRHSPKFSGSTFHFWNRGWLGAGTYAGGHDKLGHLMSNYISQFAVTGMYEAAGYDRLTSIYFAAGITFIAYNLVELFDGFTSYGWEYGDTAFNILGQGMAIASQLYGLDTYAQLRISWMPSKVYQQTRTRLRQRIAFLEDYSGQRFYLLANTSGIADHFRLRLGPVRYLAPALYYDTRGYRPKPAPGDVQARERNLGVAVVFDLAAVLADVRASQSGVDNAAMAASWRFFTFFQPALLVGYGIDLNHQRWHAPDFSLTLSSRF